MSIIQCVRRRFRVWMHYCKRAEEMQMSTWEGVKDWQERHVDQCVKNSSFRMSYHREWALSDWLTNLHFWQQNTSVCVFVCAAEKYIQRAQRSKLMNKCTIAQGTLPQEQEKVRVREVYGKKWGEWILTAPEEEDRAKTRITEVWGKINTNASKHTVSR